MSGRKQRRAAFRSSVLPMPEVFPSSLRRTVGSWPVFGPARVRECGRFHHQRSVTAIAARPTGCRKGACTARRSCRRAEDLELHREIGPLMARPLHIATISNDRPAYDRMRESMGAVGFTEQNCRFSLLDNSVENRHDPYQTLRIWWLTVRSGTTSYATKTLSSVPIPALIASRRRYRPGQARPPVGRCRERGYFPLRRMASSYR